MTSRLTSIEVDIERQTLGDLLMCASDTSDASGLSNALEERSFISGKESSLEQRLIASASL